jgi:AAA+ superfamily predicted ATPase
VAWYWTVCLILLAAAIGFGGGAAFIKRAQRRKLQEGRRIVRSLLEDHFRPTSLDNLTILERRFPYRVRADLQKAIDFLLTDRVHVSSFSGVRKEYSHESLGFGSLIVGGHSPALTVPPEYEEIDIGAAEPIRCLKNGLWLLDTHGIRCAVLLSAVERYGEATGVQFQIAAPNTEKGIDIAKTFFRDLEESVTRADSYRGKVLSLEKAEHSYSGESRGITVHRLRQVTRDQIILPEKTLTLLERNVLRFAQERRQLSRLGMPTKKGILFYGPPGTGKTLTINYLAGELAGHTTLLISAEQVGLLGEYMTLARLLQPSIVVLEDVDLIGRERSRMDSPCEEVLLNKLLNEMDGLKEEADIFFILTTNRPQLLEAALASRPGRVDQAIEFPLPDARGREQLARLYACGVAVADDVIRDIVQRTESVSAAFIKELMRRSVQFRLERSDSQHIELEDVRQALDEMMFTGGSLNQKLLGAIIPNGQSQVDALTPA